jgi:hypothetical protein
MSQRLPARPQPRGVDERREAGGEGGAGGDGAYRGDCTHDAAGTGHQCVALGSRIQGLKFRV